MKRGKLLNARLSTLIAKMGHTDSLTLCDAGLPVPLNLERIDLAVCPGVPGFITTLKTILEELCVEKALLAQEIKKKNPRVHEQLLLTLKEYQQETGYTVSVHYTPHESFKAQSALSRAVVRTGEITPYANIMLFSGVVF